MRLAKISCLLLLSLLVACGDSQRNTGGTTFTFFGWFVDSTGTVSQTGSISTLPEADNVILSAGLQNNLAGQFITVNRLVHSYYVPGSTVSIPDSSTGALAILRPAAVDGDFGNGVSTLPTNSFSEDSVNYVGSELVALNIVNFIRDNRASFPAAPFSLIVTSKAIGVTSAGHQIESNELQFEFRITSYDVATTTAATTAATAEATSDSGSNSDVTFF